MSGSALARDRSAFVDRYGGVYEHSPWVAERCWDLGLAAQCPDSDTLAAQMARVMLDADRPSQLALIRAHPDLAGRAARAGALTTSSRSEQNSAGLDALSDEEFERFQALNQAYKGRFGFPFIIAVRGLDKTAILEAFERRLSHAMDVEFQQALDEINKIAAMRIRDA